MELKFHMIYFLYSRQEYLMLNAKFGLFLNKILYLFGTGIECTKITI
jgi:hypothetical protein